MTDEGLCSKYHYIIAKNLNSHFLCIDRTKLASKPWELDNLTGKGVDCYHEGVYVQIPFLPSFLCYVICTENV